MIEGFDELYDEMQNGKIEEIDLELIGKNWHVVGSVGAQRSESVEEELDRVL